MLKETKPDVTPIDDVEDVSLEEDKEVNVKTAEKQNEEPKEEPNEELKIDAKNKTSDTSDENKDIPQLPIRGKTEEALPKENPTLKELKEAFPNIEEKYIKAVIVASQGVMDSAFNALLFLADPSSSDIEIPSAPVRISNRSGTIPSLPRKGQLTQLEQDELLARQLNEKYNKSAADRNYGRADRKGQKQRINDRERRRQNPITEAEHEDFYGDEEDSWSQFVEKDLPEIRDMANRQIQETANKLNNWFGGIKKSLTNEKEEDIYGNSQRDAYQSQQQGMQGKRGQQERPRFNSFGARVGDESLESHGISLHVDDDDEDIPPQLPTRARATKSMDSQKVTPNPTAEKIVAQTAYIDTPEVSKTKYNSISPEPMSTPTKINMSTNPDEDDFLINSDDEL